MHHQAYYVVVKKDSFIKQRWKNLKGWCLSIAGGLSGYVVFPVSSCVKNPVIYMSDRRIYKKSRDDKEPRDKFSTNFYLMVEGVFTIISGGCCCFGFCTALGPEEIYGE